MMIKRTSFFLLLMFISRAICAETYTVAVRAKNGIEAAKLQWQPTLDYLQTMIHSHQFKLVPIISLSDITKQAGQGKFDFIITNPASFIDIEESYGAKALVSLNKNRSGTAQNSFGSVIFTHVRNVDILNISDLKNKTVIAVSKQSFGGWKMAYKEILEHNINPYSEFKKLIFADGLQEDVVYAVRDGEADAGIVRTDQLERMQSAGDIDMRYFRVINNKNIKGYPFFLSTSLYPEWIFSAMNNISDLQAQKVSNALLKINKKNVAAQAGGYMGWLMPRNNYSVKELMNYLKTNGS